MVVSIYLKELLEGSIIICHASNFLKSITQRTWSRDPRVWAIGYKGYIYMYILIYDRHKNIWLWFRHFYKVKLRKRTDRKLETLLKGWSTGTSGHEDNDKQIIIILKVTLTSWVSWLHQKESLQGVALGTGGKGLWNAQLVVFWPQEVFQWELPTG